MGFIGFIGSIGAPCRLRGAKRTRRAAGESFARPEGSRRMLFDASFPLSRTLDLPIDIMTISGAYSHGGQHLLDLCQIVGPAKYDGPALL
jgi:hypothetical protein